jgi:hypothetical protein
MQLAKVLLAVAVAAALGGIVGYSSHRQDVTAATRSAPPAATEGAGHQHP